MHTYYLKNLSATDTEDIANMKNNRTLLVDGDGDASFLTKTVSDAYIQNMLNRLTNDFHKLTATPNLRTSHSPVTHQEWLYLIKCLG